jgi:DNA-binding CsgD family transcriptional regulator
VLSLLRAAGARFGALVVLVEDLHWADQSTRDLTTFLMARIRAEHLVLVASYRSDDLHRRHPLRPVLSELSRLASVERIDLPPFDRAELVAHLGALLGHPAPDAMVDDVLARSEGNAYFAEELAARAAHDDGLPAGLTDVLLLRLESLAPAAQRLARVASVAGDKITDAMLLAVSGLAPDELDAALRDAVAHLVLVPDTESAGTPAYRFRHALLREAVYADLLPGERVRLHAAYVTYLGTDGSALTGSASTVAHHAMAAHDLPVALAASVRAAREATKLQAPAEALVHLERALTLWSAVPDAAALTGTELVSLELDAAAAATDGGEPGRAVALARGARDRVQRDGGGPDLLALCELRLAQHLNDADRDDESVEAARRAMDLLADQPRSETAVRAAAAYARASAGIAHDTGETADIGRAREIAARAEEAARELGLTDVETDVLITESILDLRTGGSESKLVRARDLAAAGGHADEQLQAAYYLSSGAFYDGDVAEALVRLPAAIAIADTHGLTWSSYALEARVLQVIAEYIVGDWAGSLNAAQLAGSRPPDVAAARLATAALYVLVARGDEMAGYRIAELRAAWHQDGQIALIAGGLSADHLSWLGRYREAIEAAQQVIPVLSEVWGEWYLGGIWLGALSLSAHADLAEEAALHGRRNEIEAARRAGRQVIEEIRGRAEHGMPRGGTLGPEGRAWLARAEAEYARLEGRPDVELWRAALAAFDYGYVYETARGQWRLAQALVRADQPEDAAEHALAAYSAARALGAEPLANAVSALVRRARLKVSLAPGAGVRAAVADLLTPREHDVLTLLAQGMTNGQVGRSLHISPKTASVHVSNLMAKLGASGRTEVVALAYERGLLEPHDLGGVVEPAKPS